jgi:general secretion pathway protein E
MEIEPFLLASSIIGVLGIRLIRKNCTYCGQPYEPESGLLKLIPPEAMSVANFRRGPGCNECLQTGFHGRTAITEMLVVDEVFRDAVLQKMPTRALQQVAVQQGMRTMWQCGLDRAIAGQTTLEEVLRVVAVEQI